MLPFFLLLAMLGSPDFGTRLAAERRLEPWISALVHLGVDDCTLDFRWRVDQLRRPVMHLPAPRDWQP